ncbi:MAG: hypothetical protein ABGZ35_25625, partial [Planctomycetaceae bacterium]
DTICNTFGAVIFISILVAVLVSQSSRSRPVPESKTDPAVDAAIVQSDIQQARERLRVLSGQVRQQELVTKRFASQESMALAGKIKQHTEDRVRLTEEKAEAVKEITDAQAASVILQNKLQLEQAALDAASAENSRLQTELAEQSELAGRTARIPRVRKTDKMSLVYAIDDGRLFRVTTVQQTIDNVDCERTTESGVDVIRPRAGAGVKITSGSLPSSLERRFSGITSGTQFVQLFVSRDSFSQFLPVKDLLVKLGLEYEVLITDNDNVELFLGNTGRESLVQ